MSKIIKKQDITVLIESTLKSAGIKPKKSLMNENSENIYNKLREDITYFLMDEGYSIEELEVMDITGLMDIVETINSETDDINKKRLTKSIMNGYEYLSSDLTSTNESVSKNKPLMNENGLGNIGKGLAITTLTGAIVGSLFVAPNLITIKSADGEERIADKGESFVGKVTSYGEKGRHKYSTTPLIQVVMITGNGDTITFYTKENIEFNVGDTIRVTAGNVFSTSASDYEKVSESSKSDNKSLINEDFQKEMDRFKKLTNYTFKK